MKNFLLSKKEAITVAAAGLTSVLMVAGMVYSATTISTDINTGGNLTVSGTSALNGLGTLAGGYVSQASSTVVGAFRAAGAVTFDSTLAVTGASTLTGRVGIASSTPVVANQLGVHGNVWISGNLSNVANVTATGTLSVTGASTLTGLVTVGSSGYVSQASSTVVGRLEADGNVISTSGKLGAGTTTPAAELSASGSATTTLYLDTSGTKKGSCLELVRSHDGTVFNVTVGTTTMSNYDTTFLMVKTGSCK